MSTDADVLDELARRAAQDPALLDELIRQIQPQVLRICQRVLPHRADAEDACQEALLAVATKLSTFAGRSRFSTWVHAVASNAARETYRRLKRRAAERPDTWADADQPARHDRPDPRTTSVVAGTRLDLLDALEHLEAELPETVSAVVLRDIYELSYDEIADQVGIPIGTVKSRINRARAVLKDQLTPR
ncbi:sigma-70 family RNA polymerase sigma factor [Kribbella sandramycini]|uniref:RNA polymerase sigma-70 factor (ECF subfamily) n=1 Tax=Kribbella sandramycini TaxID=60450 RepID=A0A7Y4NZV7_9ACTN|nr:sigma-70 family RNA polymerase sigma factor [Kribbella sandramycini]MBB6569789.1 RNA polymerase sigma-70 factor (ECF subfamily) [Kribbella sandramycini]NOL40384.1 sigma-70 family RNA polymerase sigma factor [Kribbella sandramycini]